MIYLFFVLIVIYWVFSKVLQRETFPKLPPGPLNFPFIGNLQWLAKFPWKHFSNYGRIYGPTTYLKMGKTSAFLLNDTRTWKEAYCRPELSRHPGKLFETVLESKSIIFGNGNPEIKLYMTKTLIEFGKNNLEGLALQEIALLRQNILESDGKPMDVQAMFAIPTVNVIWTLLFGKRIEDDDNGLHKFAEDITTGSSDSSFLGRQSVLSLIPYMRKCFPSSRIEFIRTGLLKSVKIIKERIEDRARSRQKFEISNITDAYFEKEEQTDPKSNSFFAGDTSIHFVYMGLFMAGADSTSTSLEWLILFLASNPSVQQRFQEEIDEVIGSRDPSLIDRERMPYTLAVIQENFRLSVISITQFRQAKEDTKLLGYDIPKGSILIPNVFAINTDPDVWFEPNEFRPERFLNENGMFQKSDKFPTFGYGRRSCLGETIARNEIFLFATSIFQHFNVKMHGSIPSLNGNFGVLHHPNRFSVCFENRNNNKSIYVYPQYYIV